MADVIKVLRQISELEWWSFSPVPDESRDDLARPPHVVWRHQQPTQELAEFLVDVMKSFSGAVPWELTITNRNWLLQPARVPEYTKTHGLLGDFRPKGHLNSRTLNSVDAPTPNCLSWQSTSPRRRRNGRLHDAQTR